MAKLNKSTQSKSKSIPKPSNNKRPDVRDNPDSRMNEEQDFKGDDTTHNKKETEKGKLKKK